MAIAATLDTRFFFAFFNPISKRQGEWCKSMVVEATKTDSRLITSTIVISELYENMGRLVGEEAIRARIAAIKAKNIEFRAVDENIASLAGRTKLINPELPLADVIIAMTARKFTNSLILTDDPHFKKIEGIRTQWKN